MESRISPGSQRLNSEGDYGQGNRQQFSLNKPNCKSGVHTYSAMSVQSPTLTNVKLNQIRTKLARSESAFTFS